VRGSCFGLAIALGAGLIAGLTATSQFTDISPDLVREPALQYFTRPTTDVVATLNADLRSGAVHLTFDDTSGYLPSILDALHLPAESQLLIFSVKDRFEAGRYVSPHSDIVALLVFEHQMRMTNLLTRIGWEARLASQAGRPDAAAIVSRAANDVVDYMLMVDEAPLPDRVVGTSGFAQAFAAQGPIDRQGRSLRHLDLSTRLLRYSCSYMIYADVFDALPPDAREAIYRRMWQVLSGEETGAKYARLSATDRRAVVDILRDTKAYFQPISR